MGPAVKRSRLVVDSDILGWTLAIIFPTVIYCLLQWSELNWASINFIVIFSAALVLWIFRLVPEYTPAVFIILSTVLLDLSPQSILLSGFSSEPFFLALSVFGIGAVVIKSNVFYRLALTCLYHLPQRVSALQGMLFFIGSLLTPIMTAQSSRVSLIAPLLDDIQKAANIKPNSQLMNSLASAAFHGTILLSVTFLTGKSSNFVLYGMLSPEMQQEYNWLHWFSVCSVPAALLVISFFIVLRRQCPVSKQLLLDKPVIAKQLIVLGTIKPLEWGAISAIACLLLGLLTSPFHHVSSGWIAFTIFFVLLMTGALSKSDFQKEINWPFLFYLGSIIGIMRCIKSIGIAHWLAHDLSFLATLADNHVYVFLIVIYLLACGASLLFGTAAAPALLFTVLLPVAEHALINTWLIAFVLLMATESWLLPYQSSYYLCFESLALASGRYQLGPLLSINRIFSIVRLAVVILSLPVWHLMGLI